MNNKFRRISKNRTGWNGVKNLVISIVILVEVLAIIAVASFAWVETVSSIKITTASSSLLEVDTYVFTEAEIGSSTATVDLGKYFKPSGGMHFAPASSAYGDVLYFPKVTAAGTAYATGAGSFRKGNTSDMNTAYMSVTFKLRADTNADFFFEQVPTFSEQSGNMRVSVTAYTEGMSKGDLYDSQTGKPKYTKVYAMSSSTASVVNGTSSTNKKATEVEAISDHIKGKGSTKRLFAVGANETKIVTINVWLQGSSMDSNLPADITISNFGITSSLTPRHVTLIPTPTWDTSDTTEYFYAWCWMNDESKREANPSRLYGPMTLDENEHYYFEYNGTFDRTLFLRSGDDNLTKEYLEGGHWNDNTVWNKTEDTTIPNDPVDPTFIIETINGSSEDDDSNKKNINDWESNSSNRPKKSTGSWHDPATIHVAYASDQSTWGSLKATSYVGTTTSSHIIEETNSNAGTTVHTDTVHAWPGKIVQLKATANSGYAFVGWYTDAACTIPAPNANSTQYTATSYRPNAPSTASEITYYAKFKEIRTIKLSKCLDGNDSTSTACGTLYVDTHPTGTNTTVTGTGGSASKTVDKGSTVKIWAVAKTGYTLEGIYTTKTGNTAPSNNTVTEDGITKYLITANATSVTTTYYARFTTNTHSVSASVIGNSGSEVQYGTDTSTKGSSFTKTGVKYNTSVTIKAIAAAGYKFVGWYDNSTGTGTAVNTNAEYTFTLGDADVTYYAKFEQADYYLTGYIDGSDESGTTHQFTAGSNGVYTYTYKFAGATAQYITIFDGTKAYHPGSANAGSGTTGTQYNSYISGDDSNNPVPYYKWKVDACKGTTVTFTWDSVNKSLSWTIDSRELFLKPNSNWTQASARFAAYVYGDGTAWYNMDSAGDGYYKVTVPANYPSIIFCRMKGDSTTNSFYNPPKWNQTGDLTILSDKNCFTIPNNDWDGSTTTWSLY